MPYVTDYRSEPKLSFRLEDWGTFEGIGKGYAFKQDGRFYSVLETKVGSYRGNHVHPNKQYTLLLSGKARYVLLHDGEYREVPLRVGEITEVEPRVPHIMVVEDDITTFEWWDGAGPRALQEVAHPPNRSTPYFLYIHATLNTR